MIYAWKTDEGSVAYAENYSPVDVVAIEVTTLPTEPQEAWDIVGGVLVVDASVTSAINVTAIKAKAGELILSRIPSYKQTNYLARKSELQDALALNGVLTIAEQGEWDFFLAEWTWVKEVREMSNTAELAGTPVADVVWPL